MAQRQVTVLIDDVNGEQVEDGQTVAFALDGVEYEIEREPGAGGRPRKPGRSPLPGPVPGELVGISLCALKSARGEPVAEADVDLWGLRGDRRWGLVDGKWSAPAITRG